MKITICGSIGFYKEMELTRDKLVKNGHEVKIPELAIEVPEEYGGGKKVYFGQFIEPFLRIIDLSPFCPLY